MRLQIGAVVIVAAFIYLAFQGAHNFSSYFVTVQSYRRQIAVLAHKRVRVQGTLLSKSVHYDAAHSSLSFTLMSHGQTLPVVYQGAMPNERFRNAGAIVEGEMGPHGVFQATKLMIQCPNHYEAPKTTKS